MGGFIPTLSLAGITDIAWISVTNSTGLAMAEPVSNKPYRPKKWDSPQTQGESKMPFFIYDENGRYYYFDAVIKAEHRRDRRLTSHPVQTGSNITDHSFRIPSSVVFEIGVSDSMSCFEDKSDWNQEKEILSRSVNAFNHLCRLQDSGIGFTVTTRLHQYENMVIESVSAPEVKETANALKATIRFTEIIVSSNAKIQTVSSDKYVLEENTKANKQTIQKELVLTKEELGYINKGNLTKALMNVGLR
jgi:hypothetical protein